MLTMLKSFLKKVRPRSICNSLRILHNWRDLFSVISFLTEDTPNVSLKDKLRIVKRLYIITFNIDSPHTHDEILNFIRTILALPPEKKGVIVEAGCFKGSSTAKFSLAADIAERTLVVFDSFEGIPENDEPHYKNIFGGDAAFKKGDYCGALEEVKSNVTKYGNIHCCRFIQGWFDETMPGFKEPIVAAYIDVDLTSSTRTCIKFLYPLLEKGCALYSHDGHLPLVLDVFSNDEFWLQEVGFKKPTVQGFGKSKLIKVIKEA